MKPEVSNHWITLFHHESTASSSSELHPSKRIKDLVERGKGHEPEQRPINRGFNTASQILALLLFHSFTPQSPADMVPKRFSRFAQFWSATEQSFGNSSAELHYP
jgi:hypothetical protein